MCGIIDKGRKCKYLDVINCLIHKASKNQTQEHDYISSVAGKYTYIHVLKIKQ